MIYLDNAATGSPKPPSVRAAVAEALNRYAANPGRSGHDLSVSAAEMVYSCRKKIAAFFSVPEPEQIVFTKNCTEAVNTVLKGCLEPGDRAVVSSLEHNAVMRPLYALARQGVETDVAPADLDRPSDIVAEIEKRIGPKTKLVFCTHASNVFGVRLPVEEIGALCRRKGVWFGVDAAQSGGILPVDVQKAHIDFLCLAPHKGLYGPMGVGVLAVRRPLKPLTEGGTGTASAEPWQPEEWPERFESGTLNVPGIAGVAAGLDFVRRRGIDRIHEYEIGLVRMLYRGLREIPEICLYTPEPGVETSVGVLSFNLADLPSETVAAALNRAGFAVRAGLQCAPAAHRTAGTEERGTVRVSVSVYNTAEEIASLVRFLKNFAKNRRINR